MLAHADGYVARGPRGCGAVIRATLLLTGLPGSGKSTLAERGADRLGASVLAHDWAMAGLRPYPDLQVALEAMDHVTHRSLGWSLLWSLARAQLRAGRSVVLDGVARANEVAATRSLAREEGARCLVVRVECPDEDVHRARIEGRVRAIPGRYELDWEDVAWARGTWARDAPNDVDLVLDTTGPLEHTRSRLDALLAGEVGEGGRERFATAGADESTVVEGC